ncbi:ABC transporter ATP-binding protein [Paenibacillus thalictri]|uniref:ABC transporter ATP-binding protein n=1 Tax=Paenibacillus thalictri TaxID=2527873 RepID=A0A4Q9DVU8_9BACL|nr:ABC transporter ATP-binding protein [Paenibacillus thalictri]TBL80495.1 ABC transporter ATP-binding protein [Paenibacillus thalictri]
MNADESRVLQVDHITGGYSQAKPVLHDVSFHVGPGEMVGLIGLNGAGKSTTLKTILGILRQHKGAIRVKGSTLQDDIEKFRLAYTYVPESPLLYDEMTVEEHVRMAAMAYGLEQSVYEARLNSLAEQFQMADKLNRLPAHLSKGMRQKVMILSSFLVQPDLYLIDEPFLGLDPLGIRSLLDLMVERKQNGAAILISSHILSTIERYCDRFVLLHNGRVLAFGDVASLQETAGMPGASLDDVFYELTKGNGV